VRIASVSRINRSAGSEKARFFFPLQLRCLDRDRVYERFELFYRVAHRLKFGQHLCEIAVSQFHVLRFRMRLANDEPRAVRGHTAFVR